MLKLYFVLFLMSAVLGGIPDGYIMQVTPYCGSNTSSEATVTVITDLNADITARCAGGKVVNFTRLDLTKHVLPASYPGATPARDCVFGKRVDAEVYFIRIVLSYGEQGNEVYNDEEVRTVTCTFDVKGQKVSDSQTVQGRLIAPYGVLANNGDVTTSTLTLKLIDINGRAFDGRSIDLGRLVRLQAETDGSSGELGVRITTCDAIGLVSKSRYQVIRSGCGDGIVFKQDAGFVTDNVTAVTPVFRMFKLGTDRNIVFECNFTLCDQQCDGSSCENERRRRHVTQENLLRTLTVRSEDLGSHAHIHIYVTTVTGSTVDDSIFKPGRRYILNVHSDGDSGERGLEVISCDFISKKRTRPPFRGTLLEDGCGTIPGYFSHTKGFVSEGLNATSDSIRAFNFRGDWNLAFECLVDLCRNDCHGHSCDASRHKRDAGILLSADEDITFLSSRLISTAPSEVTSVLGHQGSQIEGTNLVVFGTLPSL